MAGGAGEGAEGGYGLAIGAGTLVGLLNESGKRISLQLGWLLDRMASGVQFVTPGGALFVAEPLGPQRAIEIVGAHWYGASEPRIIVGLDSYVRLPLRPGETGHRWASVTQIKVKHRLDGLHGDFVVKAAREKRTELWRCNLALAGKLYVRSLREHVDIEEGVATREAT